MVYQNQQQYYESINQSTIATDCGNFIEFMLSEILATLQKQHDNVNDTVNDTVSLIKANPEITLDDMALKLNKSRRTITRNIKKLKEDGIISRIGSDKSGHWKVNSE